MRQLLDCTCAVVMFFACFTVLGRVDARASDPQNESEGVSNTAANDYFERFVRPLLSTHCLECHSAQSDSPGGNLRLDDATGWQTGGDLGPAIIPGNAADSLFMQAIRYSHATIQMPPDGRLAESDIKILERWIADGAFDPRDASAPTPPARKLDLQEGRSHWAFQPISPVAIPEVDTRGEKWAINPIDRFVWAAYAQNQLTPVPAAKRVDLLRRAAIDLTGLPPSYDEVQEFLQDHRPDAWDRQVDRLLASPQYGQRWGRHWLDLARYADSNGMDENIAHGNAWRYRDYIVQSFNDDKPFDQLTIEQIAGDQLPATDDEATRIARITATGYLTIGPKVLAEVDKTKMEMDIIDEQIDTLGRTFMAMTFGCARCHDHKFDPIRTADYYAMAGVFKSTKTMEDFKTIAKWNETSIATQQQLAEHAAATALVEQAKQAVQQFINEANAALLASKETGATLPENPEAEYPAETLAKLNTLRDQQKQAEAALPELPTAMAVVDYPEAINLPIHIRGNHLTLGEMVPRGLPAVFFPSLELQPIEHQQSGREDLARWLVDGTNPLTPRVLVNRLWLWHFGRGIVNTPDNFGLTGELPTNGPLLDWLANELVQSQWSIKHLQRLILTSQTYQLSSQANSANTQIDPQNRFFWRSEVRRYDAETIRDSMLSVSGLIDLRMGGTHLHVKNREFFFDHTSKDTTRYDFNRRSIYLPVVRNNLYDLFQLFDYPDPSVASSERVTSTIASQALLMLNSDFTIQAAESLATRLLTQFPDDDLSRLSSLYQQAFSREPTESERQRDLKFLSHAQNSADHRQAWILICQAALVSNEFLHTR